MYELESVISPHVTEFIVDEEIGWEEYTYASINYVLNQKSLQNGNGDHPKLVPLNTTAELRQAILGYIARIIL
jgi:hypothetical protein